MSKTLDYYDKNAASFSLSTQNVDFTYTQDLFLSYLNDHSLLLDLGCGSGRDTKYFLNQGYCVEASDGSMEMCKIASLYAGIEVKHQLFHELDQENYYDGIWACSSILHLTKDELLVVLGKICKALKRNGYFYTSFKYGSFEGYRKGRYFIDLTEASFLKIIEPYEFQIIQIWVSEDVRKGREEEKWLNIILQKQ